MLLARRSSSKLIKVDAARSLIEEHRDLILERLHAVESGAKRFSETIASSALPAKGLIPIRPIAVFKALGDPGGVDGERTAADYRELDANASRLAAADAFSDFDYEHEDARNQSPKCFGVVGAPAYVMEEARHLNYAKDELKAAIQPISNLRIQLKKIESSDATGSKFREVSTMLLRETGRSSTNLLAVYRHIPIISEPVHAIRFMVTNTRSVPRVSVADLREKAADRPDILQTLSETPGLLDDEPLLVPKKRYYRMRAKILLQQMQAPDSRRRIQRIVSAELPILFPMLKADSRWPDVRGPGATNQQRRSPPTRMEDEPLATLGAQSYYRLKAEFRS